MATIQRIVVGIDFSVFSTRVLEYGARLAKRNGAELVAVNVINKHQIDSIRTAISDECLSHQLVKDYLENETAKRLEKIKELFEQWVTGQVSTRIIIRRGVPFEEIIKVVNDERVDLVVISSKGRTNFRDYMFGTTSEKIFRHCPVPLLSLNLRD